MSIRELGDSDLARRFLVEGLWCQQVVSPPTPASVQQALQWSLEAASAGTPLPPIGFIADLGHIALGQDHGTRHPRDGTAVGLPAALARSYEDHLLGKLYADWRFQRAADAIRRYQERKQDLAIAFVIHQFCERAGCPGVFLSPGVIRGLRESSAEDVLQQGFDLLSQEGMLPLLSEMYEELITAARRCGEVLGAEDVTELELGTALLEMGQRVALRQLLQAAERLAAGLPAHPVRPLAGRREVPTRVLDEDSYPVGGYASLSTRGTLESLLHSQLAYMENDRPDLFDIKYLRDELLYYSRDENQFLRRRRTFVFALLPDLVQTRFKDSSLPWQRVVLLFGLLLTAVRTISSWLSTDALQFEFLFLDEPDADTLGEERKLLQLVFREQIANGTVLIGKCPGVGMLAGHCVRRGRRSLCHCLLASTGAALDSFRPDDCVVSRLIIPGPRPDLQLTGEAEALPEAHDLLESWGSVLERLLQAWL